jgi:hypothetical protein
VNEREKQMRGEECEEVFVGPYILHFDKTQVDQLGNHVMAPVHASLGNYDRTFQGKTNLGYKPIAFVPVLKPDSSVQGWTKDTPEFRWAIFTQGRLVGMVARHFGHLRSYH